MRGGIIGVVLTALMAILVWSLIDIQPGGCPPPLWSGSEQHDRENCLCNRTDSHRLHVWLPFSSQASVDRFLLSPPEPEADGGGH